MTKERMSGHVDDALQVALVDQLTIDAPALRRSSLVDRQGRTFPDFRRSLTPRYRIVWFHIAIGWLMVASTATALVIGEDHMAGELVGQLALIVFGAVAIGFWLHFLLLFQHEGSHYNLAANRSMNDWLTNAAVGIFVGEDVRNYRKVHLDHHRYLGTQRDTEHSYFEPLDVRFFLRSLSGLRMFRVIAARWATIEHTTDGVDVARPSHLTPVFLIAMTFNGAIVLIGALTDHWVFSVSWILASLMVLPLLISVRQLLEHRSESADPTVDYTKFPHGAVNRLFGVGPLASTLGAAGFNRHLLHHWDAGVSYTRLGELERFLLDTEFGSALRQRQTTYVSTLWTLAFRD